MKAYFTHRSCRLAVQIALGCFATGGILFLILLAFRNGAIANLALIFLIFAVMANALLLLGLLIFLIRRPNDFEQYVTAALIVLLNYPIAALWIFLLS